LPANQRVDVLLFGETAGCIVVSCPPAHVEAVTEQANALGVPVTPLGEVTDQPQLSLTLPDNQAVTLPLAVLVETFTTSFAQQLHPSKP
jgi:selenophosphate synthetase-related protein